MIPLTEFTTLLRRNIDADLVTMERAVVSGQCYDGESAEATALAYVGAVGHIKGLRKARDLMDDLVKQLNAGDL